MLAQSFRYIGPELRVFAGPDVTNDLVREIVRTRCRRVFLIHSRSLGHCVALNTIRNALGELLVAQSDAVDAGSPVDSVLAMAEHLGRCAADSVVVVGGGSAIVTARAASIVMAEQRRPEMLCTVRSDDGSFHTPKLLAPKLAQFVVPTTPTTAMAKAGSAVHDPTDGRRFALFDPKMRARAILLQQDFFDTAPKAMHVNAALHALSSAIETLQSPQIDPVSESMLLHSVRLVTDGLASVARGDTLSSALLNLAYAAVMCGRGTDAAGGGVMSALTHAVCANTPAGNGVVSAILLPHCMSRMRNSHRRCGNSAPVIFELRLAKAAEIATATASPCWSAFS